MINDGGPAFPLNGDNAFEDPWNQYHGMSLRDFFAAAALAGLYAARLVGGGDLHLGEAAELCFTQADAMLVEKAKVQP